MSDDDPVLLNLRRILTDAQAQLERTDDSKGQRHIFVQMLGRFAQLANRDPGVQSGNYIEPILRLCEALIDLDRGRTPALLKPSQVDSRPVNPGPIRYLHGMAGACLELALRQCVNSRSAGATIADVLNRAGYRLPTGLVAATAASSWRKAAKQPNTDEMIRLGYLTVLDEAEKLGGSSDDVFELALDALAKFVTMKALEAKPPS